MYSFLRDVIKSMRDFIFIVFNFEVFIYFFFFRIKSLKKSFLDVVKAAILHWLKKLYNPSYDEIKPGNLILISFKIIFITIIK